MDATRKGQTLIPTPKWFIALRVFQIVFALVVVAMAGWWIHGLYYDALGFAIVCGLFTWIIALYALLTEHVSTCRTGYNAWAVLSLDALMIVFWLSSMAAVADRRSKFTVAVTASCSSDGSAINSGHCTVYRRDDDDVVGVASQGALAVLSAIAGVSALVMLLFVVTFAYACHFFRLAYAAAGGGGGGDAEKGSEMQNTIPTTAGVGVGAGEQQSKPFLSQEQQYQYNQQQQGVVDPALYAQQQQYVQNQNPAAAAAAPPYDPYVPQQQQQQQTAYTGGYPQQQQQHQPVQQQQQYPYSPQGTPAPGQPYQLPAQ
ncbi:hypothetical protein F5X96DRAFT_388801 [Biscogniauxia mediterranea]|nr:hypothetical protein F5X96DRAFT_388801 [Biscogniauxia mediterranea]